MISSIFKVFRVIMAFIFIFWILSTIKFMFEAPLYFLFGITVVLVLFFYKKDIFINIFEFINSHKSYFSILIVVYQIMILLLTAWMIRSDAASVYRAATFLQEMSVTEAYFSRYPNNLLLLIYERMFFNLFGLKYAIWVMQLLNMVYLNFSLFLLYLIAKKHFSSKTADITYFFSVFIIGFSPQFMAMYTDIMLLPIIAIQLYFISELTTNKFSWYNLIGLAVISAIGIFVRPTAVILIVAALLVLLLRNFNRTTVIRLITLVIIMLSVFKVFDYLKDQQTIVELKKQDSITALAYIDLGLTFNGADQIDFQRGLSMFVEEGEPRFSNRVVLADINRRLDEYTPLSFAGHLFLKFYNTVKEGTLQWVYRSPIPGDKLTILNPLLPYTESNLFAKIIRKFLIESDSKYFTFYKYVQQITWIVISIGLLFNLKYIKNNLFNDVLLFTIFGGLLFLMIFEGGKTRYLIQFLPEILLVSSMGICGLMDYFKNNRLKTEINSVE